MNTKISISITAIALLLLSVTTLMAQNTKLYFKKNGETVFQTAVSDIDTILFHIPGKAAKVNESFNFDPNVFHFELADTCALYSALAYNETRITTIDDAGLLGTKPLPPLQPDFSYYLSHYADLKKNNSIIYFWSGKDGDGYVKKGDYTPYVLHAQLKYDGYDSIISRNYHDSIEDNISYTLAYKEVNEGEILLAVIFKGTDYVEWRGDMDVWGKDGNNRGYRHYSFEVANKEVQDSINNYITDNHLDNDKYRINLLITGHSRGAAVANLLAVDQEDKKWCNGNIKNVYAYTFATPNNTTAFNIKHSNIFNFCFDDDFVPQVPLKKWFYGKSGTNFRSCADSLNKNSSDFKDLEYRFIQLSEGRNPGFNYSAVQKVLPVFANIAPTVNDYYNNIDPIYFLEHLKSFSLHTYMRDYVAEAAINLWSLATLKVASDQIDLMSDLGKIANFFVDGIHAAYYVNDTHQALTYYNALISGKNNFMSEDGLTQDVHNILPDEYIKKLEDLGFDIHGGNNPPNIEGTYLATPLELVNSSASMNIAEQWDMYVTFSGQNNTLLTVNADYTMQAEGPWWSTVTMSSKGPGSFIVGEGNKFTVFVNAIREQSGYTAKTVEVFSGEIEASGIRNYQWAVIMVDDRGDPLNTWIENGEAYWKRDQDGFSERVNQSKAPSQKTEMRNTTNKRKDVVY